MMNHIMRHEPVTPEEVAEALDREASDVASHLQLLAVQGWLDVERRGDEQRYRVRLNRRRRRALPPGIWQVLENRWQVSIFRAFSDDVLQDFIGRFALRRYAAGEYLFRAGEWGEEMFVINEGTVELVARSTQGEELVVQPKFAQKRVARRVRSPAPGRSECPNAVAAKFSQRLTDPDVGE